MLMFALRFLGASSDGIWRQRYQWWHVHGTWNDFFWKGWGISPCDHMPCLRLVFVLLCQWGKLRFNLEGEVSMMRWMERWQLLQRINSGGWNESYKKEGKDNLALLCRGYCLQLCICMSISRQIQFESQDIWFEGWQKIIQSNELKWCVMTGKITELEVESYHVLTDLG